MYLNSFVIHLTCNLFSNMRIFYSTKKTTGHRYSFLQKSKSLQNGFPKTKEFDSLKKYRFERIYK